MSLLHLIKPVVALIPEVSTAVILYCNAGTETIYCFIYAILSFVKTIFVTFLLLTHSNLFLGDATKGKNIIQGKGIMDCRYAVHLLSMLSNTSLWYFIITKFRSIHVDESYISIK